MTPKDKQPDRVLIFDIKGPFAHFRKYYTNSSSLSYIFPPRTVVTGLIAGLLGYPNEKAKTGEIYYELFNTDKCKIAVSLFTIVKKFMQTVNYIKTKTDQASRYSFEALITGTRGSPTQIPLEILMSDNQSIQDITYRVYFYHRESNIYSNLKDRLIEQKFVYPPFLGMSEFLATIKYITEGEIEKNDNNTVEINTVCRLDFIEPIFEGNNMQYLIEKMPRGFLNDRTPLKPENYIFDMKNRSVKVRQKSKDDLYIVSYLDNGCAFIENIMFM